MRQKEKGKAMVKVYIFIIKLLHCFYGLGEDDEEEELGEGEENVEGEEGEFGSVRSGFDENVEGEESEQDSDFERSETDH